MAKWNPNENTLGYDNGCFSLLFPTQSLGSLARIAVCPARPKPRPCVKLYKSELFSWRVEKLKPWDYRYQGGLDADSFEQKHGCNIFKSFQINSQCLILNKFRFKEPANGQSLARQPLIGKYQNGILKNPLNREFKVTISRHLVGFNCDPILVICILYIK